MKVNYSNDADRRRDGSRHPGRIRLQQPDQPGGGHGGRRLFRHGDGYFPAPGQDDHRPPGVLDPGRRNGRHGGCRHRRPHRRQGGGMVPDGVAGLADHRLDLRQPVAAGRQCGCAAAGCRRGGGPEDLRPEPQGLRDPRLPSEFLRGDGQQRDPANPGVLGVRRAGAGPTARHQGPHAGPGHRGSGAGDAEGHRLRHALRPDRRVRRRGERDHHAGAGRAAGLRQVHRQLLPDPRRAVGRADRRRLAGAEEGCVPSGQGGPPARAAGLLHRVQRSRPTPVSWSS